MRCGFTSTLFLCAAAAQLALAAPASPADWPMFRGPQGAGVSESASIPTTFGPATNVLWKTPLPFGHSSPVIIGDRIFLTGAEGGNLQDSGRAEKVIDAGGKLFTFCLDKSSGKILWRREAPRPRIEIYQRTNSPASPSPASDGRSVFVFLADYGILAYGLDGNELWRTPLGPFNNVNGHGSSPIVWRDLVILVCDQDTNSYIIALDKKTGRQRWRAERPEVTRSYVTPLVVEVPNAAPELIVPGAYQVTAYHAATGEKLWWTRGFSWQPKSLPILHDGIVYVHGWEGGGEAETPTETPTWEQTLAQFDKNADAKLTPDEVDERMRRSFYTLDLDGKGHLLQRDWDFYRARRAARNTLLAIRPGGRGDITQSHILWRMQKFLPNVPSPLIYRGVLYLVKDGGILTTLDPKTGSIHKQGRLTGALDTYYSSPVAAAGRVLLVSQNGVATLVKAAPDWEIESTLDLDEPVLATPAILDGRIYLRTRGHLYCFGK